MMNAATPTSTRSCWCSKTTRPTVVKRAGVPGTVAARRKSRAANVTPAMKRIPVIRLPPPDDDGVWFAPRGTSTAGAGVVSTGADVVAGGFAAGRFFLWTTLCFGVTRGMLESVTVARSGWYVGLATALV